MFGLIDAAPHFCSQSSHIRDDGEEEFAAFTYLHSDAQNPICGTAHNVTSPELLYVSGSSGGQFDERARQLQGSRDVVAVIVANAPPPSKAEKQ